MKSLPFFLFLLLNGILVQAQETLQFPNDYLGIYTGTLHIDAERGKQDIPMEFHLTETDSTGVYNYILVYGAGDKRQERNYTLIEKDPKKGIYAVDENNGIILDDKVIDNRMYALFEVGGNLLTTFITFEKDHMVFEIVFAPKDRKNVTYAEGEEQTEVISYPITTVQRAVLQKQ
ncbi:hypothetical protein POV27_03685 [Aureisphaera galaxeae]|uniref:hypothetical protein n=1 Tax=Aureisphaera galaxeae TaxID=1538023 RepID=UPI00234FDB63|nr:hypothetical protein [Aureisphaera galaxeae]MDC8003136.1 hypothetical protein [Aureisphaera galaxeae]